MDIYVRTFTGRSIPLRVQDNDTIDDLKAMIDEREGIPPKQQRLVFAGRQLKDGRRICDYNIRNEAVLYLTLRFSGHRHHFPPPSALPTLTGPVLKRLRKETADVEASGACRILHADVPHGAVCMAIPCSSPILGEGELVVFFVVSPPYPFKPPTTTIILNDFVHPCRLGQQGTLKAPPHTFLCGEYWEKWSPARTLERTAMMLASEVAKPFSMFVQAEQRCICHNYAAVYPTLEEAARERGFGVFNEEWAERACQLDFDYYWDVEDDPEPAVVEGFLN